MGAYGCLWSRGVHGTRENLLARLRRFLIVSGLSWQLGLRCTDVDRSQPTRVDRAPIAEVRPFPYAQRADAELVAALVRGEPQALGAIWDRYVRTVRDLLYLMLGPDSAVDDLVQEVFLGLFRSAGRLQDPSSLRAYLCGIAARRASMELRGRTRRRRWISLTGTGRLPERAAEQSPVDARDALRALSNLLGQLSRRDAMAFVLHHVYDMSPAQVGTALGVSEGTAKRAIRKGRTRVISLAERNSALRPYLQTAEDATDKRGSHG